MKSLKRGIAVTLTCIMTAALLAACINSAAVELSQESSAVLGTAAKTDSDKPYNGATVTWAMTDNVADSDETRAMVELIKEKTGIHVELSITPTADPGDIDKTLVSLMAGEDIDIIGKTPIQLEGFYYAGVLEPLDELAANIGYDMDATYGGAVVKFGEETYALPAERDIWLTYYNKDVFDDAGIPYPTAEGWTWEKYVETAEKLTDAEKGIWGSFLINDAVHTYMYATQSGIAPYKENGTSNLDDPAFADSMEWFFSLGNELKIQPDSVEVAAGTYPYNSFVIKDNIGMYVSGGWVASMLTTRNKYPRDWKAGILPMPYPEGSEPSSLFIDSCYAVSSTSSNKGAAFEVIKCIAENKYKLGYGRIPAKVLTEEEARAYIEETLIPMFAHDEITADDFMAGWFDSDRHYISEKIVGPADAIINQIIIEESALYGQGAKSLDDAVKSMKERSDFAIEEMSGE